MGLLSEKDRARVAELKRVGVFEPQRGTELNHQKGVILICCSDGDRSHHIFTNHVDFQRSRLSNPRVHIFAIHGGALRIAKNSPANNGHSTDALFLSEIGDARDLKGIDQIALYIHTPCGKAAVCKIDLDASINLLFDARAQIESEHPEMKVACFCHVDYGEDDMEILSVSKSKWLEVSGQNQTVLAF